ncbi:MAG TPA: hypothetical protein VGL69_19040 [Solirubrobacteraceae bacterium]|jgi:hypothetical protein
MNPLQDHALATERHAERYRSSRRPRGTVPGARERVGLLLVEAGLHLMVRGDRTGPGAVR